MDEHAVAESLKAVAARAVVLARRQGADQAEVGVSYEEGLSVSVRMGELESVERQRDRGLAITVYRDRRKGSASTTDFSATSVEDTVRKAISIGSFTTADEYAGLADAELMADEPQDLDLYFPWDVDVDRATELALRSENSARSFDARIANSEGASVSSGVGQRVYANSHGFVGAYPTSTHSMSCSVLAKVGRLARARLLVHGGPASRRPRDARERGRGGRAARGAAARCAHAVDAQGARALSRPSSRKVCSVI